MYLDTSGQCSCCKWLLLTIERMAQMASEFKRMARTTVEEGNGQPSLNYLIIAGTNPVSVGCNAREHLWLKTCRHSVLAPKLSGGECSVFVGAASTILYNDRSFQDRDATNSAHRKQHGH